LREKLTQRKRQPGTTRVSLKFMLCCRNSICKTQIIQSLPLYMATPQELLHQSTKKSKSGTTCWAQEKDCAAVGLRTLRPASPSWPIRPPPHMNASQRPPSCQSSGRCTAHDIICSSILRSHTELSFNIEQTQTRLPSTAATAKHSRNDSCSHFLLHNENRLSFTAWILLIIYLHIWGLLSLRYTNFLMIIIIIIIWFIVTTPNVSGWLEVATSTKSLNFITMTKQRREKWAAIAVCIRGTQHWPTHHCPHTHTHTYMQVL